uniref:5'-(N(7)-methylguanosine 5'-triphospho)-[mRNA] hydrolase n=1 Tax=Pundamilia nyererei TaxID=303518 RepID=A0A3B4FSB6_9CICH
SGRSAAGGSSLLFAFGILLAALQRQDPYINKLLDVTGQVALYNFNSKANEWEKTEIEGTLFVYTRSASPHHGFTIMNRLSTENLVEPINKDLEFQLQDPFLLYRNGNYTQIRAFNLCHSHECCLCFLQGLHAGLR